MRIIACLLAAASLVACDGGGSEQVASSAPAQLAAITYDGAAAREPAAQIAHGKRLSLVLGCTGCHGDDLRGALFREQPGFGSLHAPNLPLRLAKYSDAQIETTLRGGRRPDGREMWVMPSEMYAHLSKPDSAALIAYLRTVPPGGLGHDGPGSAP